MLPLERITILSTYMCALPAPVSVLVGFVVVRSLHGLVAARLPLLNHPDPHTLQVHCGRPTQRTQCTHAVHRGAEPAAGPVRRTGGGAGKHPERAAAWSVDTTGPTAQLSEVSSSAGALHNK